MELSEKSTKEQFNGETYSVKLEKPGGECMKCSIGDIVTFEAGPNEIQKGEVRFIQKSRTGDILYINSFNRWAYKVTEKRIVSLVPQVQLNC